MYSINPQVIAMVQEELEKEVLALMQLLEDATDSVDMEKFKGHLNALAGALKVLELPSATAFMQAISDMADTPVQLAPGSDEAKAVYSALQCFISYLQQLSRLKQDNLLLLLPEINELRAVVGKPPMDERDAVRDCMPESLPLSSVSLRTDEERAVVASVRRLFQQGLVHAFRGANPKAAIKVMAHGVHRLRKT
ncbi:MAG: hypothetical protein EP323_06025, partial [Gammaproteobacteria bacterium]